MNNLNNNLTIRIVALFENEIKPSLIKTSINVGSYDKSKHNKGSIENLKERLNAIQANFKKLSDDLLIVGNNALENFEDEIKSIKEPSKSNAINKLRELIVSEIQSLVKAKTIEKFHYE